LKVSNTTRLFTTQHTHTHTHTRYHDEMRQVGGEFEFREVQTEVSRHPGVEEHAGAVRLVGDRYTLESGRGCRGAS
jgi:hypothetical protein